MLGLRFSERKSLFTRQPREETGRQIWDALPWSWGAHDIYELELRMERVGKGWVKVRNKWDDGNQAESSWTHGTESQSLDHRSLKGSKDGYFKVNFYWSIAALRCCVSFFYAAKWIICTYRCIPSFLDLLPISVTAEHWVVSCSIQFAGSHWLTILYIVSIVYMC